MVTLSRKNKAKKVKQSLGDRIFSFINYFVVGLFAFLCTMPFVYVLVYSRSGSRWNITIICGISR